MSPTRRERVSRSFDELYYTLINHCIRDTDLEATSSTTPTTTPMSPKSRNNKEEREKRSRERVERGRSVCLTLSKTHSPDMLQTNGSFVKEGSSTARYLKVCDTSNTKKQARVRQKHLLHASSPTRDSRSNLPQRSCAYGLYVPLANSPLRPPKPLQSPSMHRGWRMDGSRTQALASTDLQASLQ
jgi:hypothetical protein